MFVKICLSVACGIGAIVLSAQHDLDRLFGNFRRTEGLSDLSKFFLKRIDPIPILQKFPVV